MKCRHCENSLTHTFLDLGFAPPSNAYLHPADLNRPELCYPLRIKVCDRCWLVQTEDHARADELFRSDYAYFSSTSTGWVAHAAKYSKEIISKLGLTNNSYVIELASNDGYLLRNFVAAGIPCLGIEPTASTAAHAKNLGIPVMLEFFGEKLGRQLAQQGKQADLVVGNNVYAHVPDINDFTRGLQAVLKPNGTITLEFPHLMQLLEHTQFDTVYHEHFSYLSLYSAQRILQAAKLRIWHVELLSTHGGSLRIFCCHEADTRQTTRAVALLFAEEAHRGMHDMAIYKDFQQRANMVKDELLSFLIEMKRKGKKVAAYGAAAKGNTLLNYAGVKPDLLPFVCDAAVIKQGKYMPGSHIPILPPSALISYEPDYVLILPWNIATEVKNHLLDLVQRGTRFCTAIPHLEII